MQNDGRMGGLVKMRALLEFWELGQGLAATHRGIQNEAVFVKMAEDWGIRDFIAVYTNVAQSSMTK